MIAELTDWLLFLHILATMVWLGGLVTLGLLATLVLCRRDAEAVGRFVRTLCTSAGTWSSSRGSEETTSLSLCDRGGRDGAADEDFERV